MQDDTPPPDLVLHAAFVRRLAGCLLRDGDDADDAAQETLARALERPPRRPGVRAWLAAVLRNVVRRRRRDVVRLGRRERIAARPEATPGAGDRAGQREILHSVVEAIDGLDAASREVILLRHYEDLPPRAIAVRLGVPVETVKSRLKRAHERLRDSLDEERGGNVEGWRSALAVLVGVSVIGAAASSAAAATATGGIAMGTSSKIAIAAAAAALLAGSAFLLAPTTPGEGAQADPEPPPPLAHVEGENPAAAAVLAVRAAPPATVSAKSTPEAAPAEPAAPPEVPAAEPTGRGTGPAQITAKSVVELVLLGLPRVDGFEATLEPKGLEGRTKPATRSATLESDGVFRFRDVPSWLYEIHLRGPDGARWIWSLVVPQDANGNRRQEVRFGTAALEGGVYERDGTPGSGRRVILVPHGTMGSPSSVETTTDGEGRYRFGALPTGFHLLNAVLRPTPSGGEDRRVGSISIRDGETKRLDLGSGRSEPTWSGVARLASGTPVRGPAAIGLSGATHAGLPIDAEGRFSKQVPPGTYQAVIDFPGRQDLFTFEIVVGEADFTKDVAVSGVRVSGSLRDASTRLPFPVGSWASTPRVRILSLDHLPRIAMGGWLPSELKGVLPDADGTFRFDGVLPGRYKVHVEPAEADKRHGTVADITVGPDRDVEGVRLEVRPR